MTIETKTFIVCEFPGCTTKPKEITSRSASLPLGWRTAMQEVIGAWSGTPVKVEVHLCPRHPRS